VTSVLLAIKMCGQRVRELEAPPQLALCHGEFQSAADYFDRAADFAAEGTREFDADKLSQAIGQIQLGAKYMDRTRACVEKATQ